MLSYNPKQDPTARISWYGDESTIIRFEILGLEGEWLEIAVKTLGEFPTDVGELYQAMREFHEKQP
jgi:hypothetical protein